MSDSPHGPIVLVAPGAPTAGSPPPFRCVFGRRGVGATWVDASGELDLAVAPQLDAALRDAQSRARLVVLDLRHLEFIDVAGVRVIVEASLSAALAGRRLMVGAAAENIRAVFALTGTSDLVEMLDLDPAGAASRPDLRLVTPQAPA